MTKAALCTDCFDIVSPLRKWQTIRDWRWCQCDLMAVRWRDGNRGLLEVTAYHGPEHVRVLGLNNMFLEYAVLQVPRQNDGFGFADWRQLHDESVSKVEPGYLFHEDKRACWALVVQLGESGDVFFIDYDEARRWPLVAKKEATQ
jgi:hypothetical protein